MVTTSPVPLRRWHHGLAPDQFGETPEARSVVKAERSDSVLSALPLLASVFAACPETSGEIPSAEGLPFGSHDTSSSSIYPWAYTGENLFRLWLQNIFPYVIPRMVLRVMARGFNCVVHG